MNRTDYRPVNSNVCPGCGESIAACFFGGDCLEVAAIYREQQKEKLRDIEIDNYDDSKRCIDCDIPLFPTEHGLCGPCSRRW